MDGDGPKAEYCQRKLTEEEREKRFRRRLRISRGW